MTKLQLIKEVSQKTGVDRVIVREVVDTMMRAIKSSLISSENVYLRGFGSFILKKRPQKLARVITKNISIIVPACYVPSFKPGKSFSKKIKAIKIV
jgi:DNA-binding protein HU-beta